MDGDSFLTPEIREGFHVSEKRKKIWKIQLELLAIVDKICRENNLRYFAINGTLIGAVKYHGFVPWDDDMDIIMPRKDYDSFAKIATTELQHPYYYQSGFDEDSYFRYYSRLRNVNTTAVSIYDIDRVVDSGIFIDIFPLDGADFRRPNHQKAIINRLSNRITTYVYDVYSDNIIKKALKKMWIDLLFAICPLNYTKQKLQRVMTEIPYDTALHVIFYFHGAILTYEKGLFESSLMLKFEDRTIPVPIGYDHILRTQYGDYMQTEPSDEEKGKHHNIFFDPDRPYSYYKKMRKEEIIAMINNF